MTEEPFLLTPDAVDGSDAIVGTCYDLWEQWLTKHVSGNGNLPMNHLICFMASVSAMVVKLTTETKISKVKQIIALRNMEHLIQQSIRKIEETYIK